MPDQWQRPGLYVLHRPPHKGHPLFTCVNDRIEGVVVVMRITDKENINSLRHKSFSSIFVSRHNFVYNRSVMQGINEDLYACKNKLNIHLLVSTRIRVKKVKTCLCSV